MYLRQFTLDDYNAAMALWQQYPDGIGIGRSDTREEIAKKLERDPDLFLVAEEDGMVVGTVIGGYDGRRGLIYHLAVDHGYRGRGIGRSLMDEVERRLAAKGCLRAYLLVRSENLDVAGFYDKMDWQAMSVTTRAKNLS
ncbi:MAG: GNAT family acetyltransferase [Anaerolineae bacterium]